MKKIIASILAAACLMTAAVSVSAIEKADKPIPGGNTVFTQKEFLYEGEPTATSKWSNAWCADEKVDWCGFKWSANKIGDVDCIKIVPIAGKKCTYMDFNYYQWDNDKYYPSLDCSQYKYMAVKYQLNDIALKTAGDSQFWASQDAPKLSTTAGTGTVNFKMSATKANTWTVDVVDLSGLKLGSTAWSDTSIRQFRFYPMGSKVAEAGAECNIEWLAFFKTEAEAKAYTGPKKAETKPASTGKAAATADPIALVVLAASASLGLAFAAGKRK